MPLHIVHGDITDMHTDAVVNAANPRPIVGGGVDCAINRAAGPELIEERRKIGRIETGQAFITPAGNMHAKYVIHTVGPVWHGGGSGEEELLRRSYLSSLQTAADNGCESIAFPLISAGIFGVPAGIALKTAVQAVSDFLLDHELNVYLVIFDAGDFHSDSRLFSEVSLFIEENYREEPDADLYAAREAYAAAKSARFAAELDETEKCPAAEPDEQDEVPAAESDDCFAAGPCDEEKTEEPPLPEMSAASTPGTAPEKPMPAASEAPMPVPQPCASETAAPAKSESFLQKLLKPLKAAASLASKPGRSSAAAETCTAEEPCRPEKQAFRKAQLPAASLAELLDSKSDTFSESLLTLIDRKGFKDPDVYKRANVDRKLFSKIRNNPEYQPKKETALAFAIALRLDLEETAAFIGTAGYALSRSSKRDIIIEYFIRQGNYNIFTINETLFAFEQQPLG